MYSKTILLFGRKDYRSIFVEKQGPRCKISIMAFTACFDAFVDAENWMSKTRYLVKG